MAKRIISKYKLEGYIESLIGGRSENQDSAGAVDTEIGTLIVVCDGMGGMKGGKTASMLAVKTIIDDVSFSNTNDDPEKVLKKALLHSNDVIFNAGIADESLAGMGTTVVALLINKQKATVAYVGDSRIYQFRGKEKLFRTTDHSKVFELVNAGIMTEEEARTSESSNIILKALGIYQDVEPEFINLSFEKGDRFVLCTDGLWGAQPEPKLISTLTQKYDLESLVGNVATEVDSLGSLQGGNHDNLTLVMVDVGFDSEEKMKEKRKYKWAISILALLLCASIATIFYMAKKTTNTEIAVEEAAYALRDSLVANHDTTAYKGMFIKILSTE